MAASPSQIIIMKKKAFASLKTLADRTNHCELNLDLYRLGIFSKDAIDVSNLNSVLAVQAVGEYNNKNNSMTFSLLIDIIGSYTLFDPAHK